MKKWIFLAPLILISVWQAYEQLPIGPRIRVSKATTHITEPLAADGLPDFAAALLTELREGVTPENNGAVPYLQAMWPAELDAEQQTALCRELGMPVPQANGLTSPSEDEALYQQVEMWLTRNQQPLGVDEPPAQTLFTLFQRQPWTRDEAPIVAEWIDSHREQYNLLHEAVVRPEFYCPSPTLLLDSSQAWINLDLSVLQNMRAAVRCLSMRAYHSIGQGDLDAAWSDCRVIYGLSDRIESTTLIHELVSIALEGVADQVALTLLDAERLNESTANEMLKFYRQRPLRLSLVKAIDTGERTTFITSVLEWSHERVPLEPHGEDALNLSPAAARRIDWNVVLTMGNDVYDKLVDANRIQDRAAREEAFERFGEELESLGEVNIARVVLSQASRRARSRFVGRTMLMLLIPGINAANVAQDRRNTYRQMMPVAAALAAYRVEHGEYPNTLAPLTPALLAEQPTDFFHAAPLVYHKTDRGFLLYSLGDNQQDDHGCHALYDSYAGYETQSRMRIRGWDDAVVELLGLQDDPSLYDEDGYGPYFNVPSDADDYAVRLPVVKVELPQPPSEAPEQQ